MIQFDEIACYMRSVISFGAILLFCFLLLPFFHQGIFLTHDGETHIARFAAAYHGFFGKTIVPRWAGGTMNHGYGSPFLIFFYPLPSYLASFLHLLGVHYENTFKLLMAFAFLGGGVSYYCWTKKIFQEKIAVITAIFYLLVPYHMLDVYVKGDIGEVFSFAFLPFTLYFIEKYKEKKVLLYLFLLLG